MADLSLRMGLLSPLYPRGTLLAALMLSALMAGAAGAQEARRQAQPGGSATIIGANEDQAQTPATGTTCARWATFTVLRHQRMGSATVIHTTAGTVPYDVVTFWQGPLTDDTAAGKERVRLIALNGAFGTGIVSGRVVASGDHLEYFPAHRVIKVRLEYGCVSYW